MSEHSQNPNSQFMLIERRFRGHRGSLLTTVWIALAMLAIAKLQAQDLPVVDMRVANRVSMAASSWNPAPTFVFQTQSPQGGLLPSWGEGVVVASPNYDEPVEELPRIRRLGKLVSIEGKENGPRTVKVLEEGDPGHEISSGSEIEFDPNDESTHCVLPRLSYFYQEPFTNYRTDENAFTYMPGGGDQFGWVSFESQPYLQRGYRAGLTNSINIHLLSGPNAVPLPPRLYDFSLGYQNRGRWIDVLSYDLAASVGVFSDFEDSSRDGVRFPGHAVGMLHYKPEIDIVFGVDYLSRDDYKLLPVAGISFRPRSFDNIRMDLIFPRPRIDYTFDSQSKMYLAGRLGGGTWDIEFPDDSNDVMTYRDLQLLVGFESRDSDGDLSSLEFGYVFDRKLQFRTLTGETEFDDAFVFRIVTRK